jgi:hypothetical protein
VFIAGSLLLLLTLFVACIQQETLQRFDLTLPDSVSAGEPFTLTVNAIGSLGSDPLTTYSGTVTLAVSSGDLDPSSLEIVRGVGQASVTISAALGDVIVTVTGSGRSAEADVAVFGAMLPGGDDDPVEEVIPPFDFVPLAEDYSEDHPDLGGLAVSFNALVLVFEQGTTVADANLLLGDIGAEIVGGVPGRAGQVEGILFLRVPTQTHQQMIDLLARLRADPLVKTAVQDALLETTLIPRANDGNPADWNWHSTPITGNWGLELIRAPQLWNLNAALDKAIATGDATRTVTGILDVGFANSHEDLVYDQNLTPGTQADHGTHVAGTIAATFDNGIGVDGVNPFADLVLNAPAFSTTGSTLARRTSWGEQMSAGFFTLINTRSDIEVVNISLGYNWGSAGIDQNSNTSAQEIVEEQGAIFGLATVIQAIVHPERGLPIVVVAAGNDSNDIPAPGGGFVLEDARWGSPFTYAALEFELPNVIVVESVRNAAGSAGGATRSGFSNINGHISAPGSDVRSTSWSSTSPSDLYEIMSGTSMASPHVTGLIGYLLSLDDDLVVSEIRTLFADNDVPVAGGASPRIDAFAIALDIDDLRGDSAILEMLVDIDDGTPDGNQRLLLPSGDGDFIGEDADADGGIGDGAIDMADFRRWRDWLLQTEGGPDLSLDGSSTHPKKDVNGNGLVEAAAAENLYPRGDFNGDGRLSRSALSVVPGVIDASVTDLEVLQTLFGDPDYTASQLPDLIDSADLEIWPAGCLARPDVASVESSLRPTGSAAIVESRTHSATVGPRQVYTAAVDPGGYTARIEAKDAGGVTLFSAEQAFPMTLGSDALWRPECIGSTDLSDLVVTVTGPASAAAGDEIAGLVDLIAENVGGAAAAGTLTAGTGGYMIDVVLSSDQLVPPGFAAYSPTYSEDVLLQGGRVSNTLDLAPGASEPYDIAVGTIPTDTPAGSYFLCAQIDPDQQIVELDEGNNVHCVPIEITSSFAITSIVLNPAPPATLPFSPEGGACPSEGTVFISGTYEKSVTDPVLIFARPFTGGSLTPKYGASPSPQHGDLTGSFEQWFCLLDDVTQERPVDQIRLTIERPGTFELLHQQFVDVDYLFTRPTASEVCIDFEDPPFTLGTQYGDPVGDSPGDLVFTEQNVAVLVQNFTQGTFTGFNYAQIDDLAGLSGRNVWTNNITLQFDFSKLPFTPTSVTFEFVDLGGSENIAVNGSATTEGELASGTVGGIPVTIVDTPITGGRYGTGILSGNVQSLKLGGQEFWFDTVCVADLGGG